MRSLTIGLYLEQPITWLHRIDPRVKLFWLLSFLISPILANSIWRMIVAIALVAVTLLAGIPARIWKQQMGILLLLATMTFSIATFSPDGLNVTHQSRRPLTGSTAELSSALSSSQTCPQPQPTSYCYTIFKAGSLQINRRSLDLGIRVSTLIFTFIYGPTLYLLVTSPEEITAGITKLTMPLAKLPLGKLRIPIVEIMLTLTLALRFLPLVLEEIQNLVRAIRTRAINWKKLGLKRAFGIWLIMAERLIDNLFIRAEQTATAMQVRGFTSPNQHEVKWNPLKLMRWDILIGSVLIPFWVLRVWFGSD